MSTRDCPANRCYVDCPDVFEQLHVSYLTRGGTRVMWSIDPKIEIEAPWQFQLQYSLEPRPTATWTNVGLAVTNSFYAIDPAQRDYGQSIRGFYRVVMTAGDFVSASRAFSVDGVLSPRDWRIAQEILRKERLRASYTAVDGFLMRLRKSGKRCTRCLDIQTNEAMDMNCPNCRGTGYECGYYYPLDCVWADLSPVNRNSKLDDNATRGTVEDIRLAARMLMLPPFLSAYDVWISDRLDQRYTVHNIQHVAEIRGVPLIASVELRLIPYSDPVYKIPIPQQVR